MADEAICWYPGKQPWGDNHFQSQDWMSTNLAVSWYCTICSWKAIEWCVVRCVRHWSWTARNGANTCRGSTLLISIDSWNRAVCNRLCWENQKGRTVSPWKSLVLQAEDRQCLRHYGCTTRVAQLSRIDGDWRLGKETVRKNKNEKSWRQVHILFFTGQH